jgi:Rrf2 family protein
MITARAEYACLAMIELATRFADRKPVRLQDVTEKHGIPRRFVVLILLQMKAAGLVQTVRGPSGGYTLAKPPDQVRLADIFDALERAEEPSDRAGRHSAFAPQLQTVWKQLVDARAKVLKGVTLADLLPQPGVDYVI